ncbi:hypothetical protein Ddye_031343 [Dipteronia dyeriana]|uniref:Cation/H+ exchanger transmembrane domain-containing protein n=1 Tax=Dipteronia dyeriana TaxID=168575 RepID=A0AAD9TID1_9ROSI|nr:hypothetical protein Ddye_031343 [Dipteronia dyeriana]
MRTVQEGNLVRRGSKSSNRSCFLNCHASNHPDVFIFQAHAGIIIGPSVLLRDNNAFVDRNFRPREMVFTNSMSIIVVMYFIFLSAVKMDKSRIITAARKSMNVGLTCFIVPLIIVFSLIYIFRNSVTGIHGGSFHLFISASSSLSYFPVITDVDF